MVICTCCLVREEVAVITNTTLRRYKETMVGLDLINLVQMPRMIFCLSASISGDDSRNTSKTLDTITMAPRTIPSDRITTPSQTAPVSPEQLHHKSSSHRMDLLG